MERLSKPLRRLVAGLILALLPLAVWYGVVAPTLNAYHDLQDQIGESERVYEAYAAMVQTQSGLGDVPLGARTEELKSQFLAGESEAVAIANLQSHLKEFVDASGVQFLSAAPLPTEQQPSYDLIGVRLDLSTDLRGLQAAIQRIESATPYLIISGATVHGRDFIDDTERYTETMLAVSLNVLGARWTAPAETSP